MLPRKTNKEQGTGNKVSSSKSSLSFVLCPLSRQLVGIGIDLLSIDRAKDLLRRHGRSFFDRILAPCEKKQKPVCSALQLARYFTAKEAFFKSSNLAWTDMNGFAGMWIETISKNRFKMGCKDSKLIGEGTFFKMRHNFGARVITWQS